MNIGPTLNSNQSIERVQGDGGPVQVTDEDLAVFKSELRIVQSMATKSVMSRRIINEETRFCIWEGQADDGRKHDSEWHDRGAFPFEGASDARVRIADDTVNDHVRLCMSAYNRGVPSIVGHDAQGAQWGARMQRLLDHEVKNVMGQRARVEMQRFLQYVNGDSPAACMMGVYWHQETGLRMQDVTIDDLVQQVMQQMQQTGAQAGEQEAEAIKGLFQDPAQEETALKLFENYFPKVKPARAQKAVKMLRKTGECSIPMPYLRVNEPRWVAHRLFEDVFLPANTAGDMQRGRYYHVREWLTEAEVREKEVSEGWSPEFIEEVLKYEGRTFFPEYYRARMNEIELRQATVEENKGYYEVLRTYFRAVNDDGVMGVYILTWHAFVDFPAHDRVLLDYPHGKYPGAWLQREILNVRLMDSRGIPEMMMTDQWSAKTLHDLTMDRATLTTIPPIFVPANRPNIELKMGPLSKIKRNRSEDYELMKFGEADDHDKAIARIEKRIAKYYGTAHPEIPPEQTTLTQQDFVDDFLAVLTEIYWQTLQLCQYYLTDDELRQITGATPDEPLFNSTDEIQGRFGLSLCMNVGDVMNRKQMMDEVEVVAQQILPTDTLSTVDRSKLARALLQKVDANLAADVCLPVESANQRELDDEDNNLAKIMAGVQPPMMEQGQNFAARMQRLQENVQKNKALQQRLQAQPDSMAILQERMKHLQFMQQQEQNKQIGRVGAKSALADIAAPTADGAAA